MKKKNWNNIAIVLCVHKFYAGRTQNVFDSRRSVCAIRKKRCLTGAYSVWLLEFHSQTQDNAKKSIWFSLQIQFSIWTNYWELYFKCVEYHKETLFKTVIRGKKMKMYAKFVKSDFDFIIDIRSFPRLKYYSVRNSLFWLSEYITIRSLNDLNDVSMLTISSTLCNW